jgi:hypothetical protein
MNAVTRDGVVKIVREILAERGETLDVATAIACAHDSLDEASLNDESARPALLRAAAWAVIAAGLAETS